MTDKLLREAAQNILNGIETGAIKIETDQDESWANALSALRSALAQSESEPDKLEKAARAIYDIMPFDGVGSEKKPAWQEGGNSLKQDEARQYARVALKAQEKNGPRDWTLSQREEPEWKTITLRNERIRLNNLRWWQFWRPKYQEFRLDLSMKISGPVNVASVQAQLMPEDSL